MRNRLSLTLGAVAVGALLVSTTPAWAHDTGTEARTRTQCGELPAPLRGACKACVSKKKPHHFHPDNKPHRRCRPDNGRP